MNIRLAVKHIKYNVMRQALLQINQNEFCRAVIVKTLHVRRYNPQIIKSISVSMSCDRSFGIM